MKTIANYAVRVLKQNYKEYFLKFEEYNTGYEPNTIAEWCELEAQSDPHFYRWLFNDPDIDDFGSDLSGEEIKQAIDFFESL